MSAKYHPMSLTKSSTSISGASSVSNLNLCHYSNTEKSVKESTELRSQVDSSRSHIESSRAYASSSASQQTCQQSTPHRRRYKQPSPAATESFPRAVQPHLIATVSVGFDKGDYLVREEKGCNVYFSFLEEAYNFIVQKGYSRMPKNEEADYIELIKRAQKSVPGGCRFNNGKLLMVLKKKLVPVIVQEEKNTGTDSSEWSKRRGNFKRSSKLKHLTDSSTTLPTDDESSTSDESCSYERSSLFEQSSCSTSYVDSWE